MAIVQGQARAALRLAAMFAVAATTAMVVPHRTGAWLPLHLFLVGSMLLAISRGGVTGPAHAPGQVDWQPYGCARAEECGVPSERVVNTWPVENLLEWTSAGRD